MAATGALCEWLQFLCGSSEAMQQVPVWPPDAFAIAAALLKRTGAYSGLVNGMQLHRAGARDARDNPVDVGREWRRRLEDRLRAPHNHRLRDACPDAVAAWWQVLIECGDRSLDECFSDSAIAQAAIDICVACDEASRGIGISGAVDPFLGWASVILDANDGRSFCLHIAPAKLAVLGKQHTPQRGCSIRSLTHNLALYSPAEIQPYWAGPYKRAKGDPEVFNLLLLPWPTDVRPNDFTVVAPQRVTDGSSRERSPHRYFDYAPHDSPSANELVGRVERALAGAVGVAEQIHAIVLPELAVTWEQFLRLERLAVESEALLISGVRGTPSSETHDMPVNACAIQPLGLTASGEPGEYNEYEAELMRRFQYKHHRWCIDRHQVLQYDLGGRLPASRDCWERIYIGQRDINFVTLASWLTLSVLICEDLARQDPVTEVLRSVGPNLVMALLMDGPQLRSRWASRYASVLAEDPGSSVLSLTSLGMARRSRPREGDRPGGSRVIALWRDAIHGEREIGIDEGDDACVLSLVCQTREEFTLDGRGDQQNAHFPVYAGAFSFNSRSEATGAV